jgi:hypothetical protein
MLAVLRIGRGQRRRVADRSSRRRACACSRPFARADPSLATSTRRADVRDLSARLRRAAWRATVQTAVEPASSMAVDVPARQGAGVKRASSADDRLRRSASLLMGGAEMRCTSGVDDDDEDDDDDDDDGARKRAGGASSGTPGAGDAAAAAAAGGSGRTMADAMQGGPVHVHVDRQQL